MKRLWDTMGQIHSVTASWSEGSYIVKQGLKVGLTRRDLRESRLYLLFTNEHSDNSMGCEIPKISYAGF